MSKYLETYHLDKKFHPVRWQNIFHSATKKRFYVNKYGDN